MVGSGPGPASLVPWPGWGLGCGTVLGAVGTRQVLRGVQWPAQREARRAGGAQQAHGGSAAVLSVIAHFLKMLIFFPKFFPVFIISILF